jgi:CSLREA domain-containing protein
MHRTGGRPTPRVRQAFTVVTAGVALTTIAGPGFARAAAAQPAAALKFHVNTTVDAHDAHPGDGRCADAAGQCTLRAAIEEADAARAGRAVTISVPAGYYRLTLGPLDVGGGASRALNITVDGAGPGSTVISGDHAFRVITVSASATVLLNQVQITEGHVGPDGYGGGVFSSGRLTIAGSALDGNAAGAGGGVDNAAGSLVVTGSSIEHNRADGFGGGGIKNGGPRKLKGSVLVVSSTIDDNSSSGNSGGGIFSGENGHPGLPREAPARPPVCTRARCAGPHSAPAPGLVLTVEDSDVSGNLAAGGAGIAAQGKSTLTGSVIDDNRAARFASCGGLLGVSTISDSTIDGNSADGDSAICDGSYGRMTITDSTIEGNHSPAGPGVMTVGADDFITGSTIADNTAGSKGQPGGASVAAIQGGGTLHLSNSTVVDNPTIPPGGAAIVNIGTGGEGFLSFDTVANNVAGNIAGPLMVATATILATNGKEPDCQGPLFKSGGYNLATDHSCGLTRPTDLSGVNPRLGPLASNGGPTSTEALLTGSPAINAGGLPDTSGCPLTDQRGESRPWGPACDTGAYEAHYHLG